MFKILKSLSLLIFVFLPGLSMACSATAINKKSGATCVDMGQYQLFLRSFGKSSPVVIFESGLGDDSTVWGSVTEKVAEFARVVVYDRAGLGKSDPKPGNSAITSQDMLNDLKTLLKKENIKPPYILVGHSNGGLTMQLFAQEYPNEVAGAILIDSMTHDQNFHDPVPSKDTNYYREAIAFQKNRLQLKNANQFPSIPLIVLTATNHPGLKKHEALWQQWQHGLTFFSPHSIQIFAWNSGHYIQQEQPQLVVDAIYTMIRGLNFHLKTRKIIQSEIKRRKYD